MRLAVRRTLRQGVARKGLPVEDLGVQPDVLHKMTAADLLEVNRELLDKAVATLKGHEGEVGLRG